MKYALHGMNTLYSNIATDIRLASEAGYDAVELHTEKLWRYLEAGMTKIDCLSCLNENSIEVAAIDIIGNVEVTAKDAKDKLFTEAEILVEFAAYIGAPTIQLNAFDGLNGLNIKDVITLTAKNIQKISDIGKAFGVRFQYEGAAWTPIHTLEDCVALVNAVDRDNFGLVIDFWHFWASYGATPEDIAKIDPSIIYGVHVADGLRPVKGGAWPSETALRGFLPGQVELPVAEWADAIKATGFDGFASGEILNERLWECDHYKMASTMLACVKKLM